MKPLENKNFNFIVYGGTIKGVLTAIYLAKKDKKVLLLNKYGFLGGAITENLALLQKLDERGLKNSIFEKSDIFYSTDNKDLNFINPEQLKFLLQDLLLAYNIEPLFHVSPISVKNKQIVLSGKEGLMTINAENIIDCSDNLYLEFLQNNVIYNKGIYFLTLNGVTTEVAIKDILNPLFVYNISGNRYFTAFEIKFSDILQLENNAHNKIREISKKIINTNCRIELLPISTYLRPVLVANKLSFGLSNFTNIPEYYSILQNSINLEQSLIKHERNI